MREPIVISWEEWKASRAAKRENLQRLGLDAPSRRTSAIGSQGLEASDDRIVVEVVAPRRGLLAVVPLGESGILHADLRPCGFHLECRPFTVEVVRG